MFKNEEMLKNVLAWWLKQLNNLSMILKYSNQFTEILKHKYLLCGILYITVFQK